MKCVQCLNEMVEYGSAGQVEVYDMKGNKIGVKSLEVNRCIEPECPNYNLLQGLIEK
jgi:hypothetical protein